MKVTPIDLSRLPVPSIIEVIDFEAIYAARKARLVALYPAEQQAEIAATLQLESEPLAMMLQENAYREVLLRQRVNDAARAGMLAYSTDTDLDNLVAFMNIKRLAIAPADEVNNLPAVMEKDADLRRRFLLAPEGFSVAGPEGAYISATLGADGRVRDASVKSPAPGVVLVSILAHDNNGVADEALIASVTKALNAEDVRPLTDQVVVQSAEVVEFQVSATIHTFPGPDPALVIAEANKRLAAYLEDSHRIGREIVISALHAALHVDGIERVDLAQPAANIAINDTQAPRCTAVAITYGGVYG